MWYWEHAKCRALFDRCAVLLCVENIHTEGIHAVSGAFASGVPVKCSWPPQVMTNFSISWKTSDAAALATLGCMCAWAAFRVIVCVASHRFLVFIVRL